ncbi:unnamed protein product [Hyaloperonospora brassicae]|uniref:Uncharacterized protein n=1 Tax=Hyaloperonospora brassicae TaxID=162125 RepID=A0AAV0TZ42_HYABA|nr:unnamed protein product [Hyaloperonospora brassicae]
MTTRNTRYWRSFLSDLLSSRDSPNNDCPSDGFYDGVCVLTLFGRVEYRDGCFQSASSRFLDVNPLQLVALFDDLTRHALQEAVGGDRERATAALRLGATVFHVVSATFSSVCAVTRGRSRGLVVEKLPFGVVAVAFSAPLQLETVFRHVDGACAALRR